MSAYFGEHWDVPATEDAAQTSTPIGEACLGCHVPVAQGDRGFAYPQGPMHRECILMDVVGHNLGACTCTDYAGTGDRRQGALLLWDKITDESYGGTKSTT